MEYTGQISKLTLYIQNQRSDSNDLAELHFRIVGMMLIFTRAQTESLQVSLVQATVMSSFSFRLLYICVPKDRWLTEAKISTPGYWNFAQRDHSFLDIRLDDRLGFDRISA